MRSRWAGPSRVAVSSVAETAGATSRRSWLTLYASLTALALLVRVPGYVHQLFDPDEATIADQAITLLNGGRMYVDAIDRKPPLPTYLYEATFHVFGNVDLRPVHVVAALLLAVAGCAIATDVGLRTWAQRVWAGALVICSSVAFLPDGAQAANYAHLALAPGALAIVLSRRRSRWSALGAGIFLAVAVMCRQTWIIGALPAAVAIIASRRWLNLVLGAVGFLAGVGGVLAWLPTREVWHWVFASNQGFLLAGPNWSMVGISFFGGLALLIVLHVPLVVGIVRRVRAAPSLRDALRVDTDLWVWWATATIAWISGFRFFAHYWIQSIPPLVLLATPYLADLSRHLRRRVVAVLTVSTLVAVGAAFSPGTFRTLPDPGPLARYVAQNTAPTSSVLIWGNFPEVLWRADRPIGGALVHSDFLTGVSGNRALGWFTVGSDTPGAKAATMRAVEANPPVLVLDTSPSNIRGYADYSLSDFPALNEFVVSRYTTVAIIDGVIVYRLTQGYSGSMGAGS